jgi:Fur family ferric uptake transcriptional regulator
MRMGGKEEEILQRHIAQHHLKVTKERRAILKAFVEAERHVSAEELHQQVKKTHRSIGLATIYRTLNLFCQCGLAQQHQFGGGHTRYELVYNVNHHDHLVCIGCGKIIEFENQNIEKLQEEVARKSRFTVFHHKLEMYGHCHACAQKGAADRSIRKK